MRMALSCTGVYIYRCQAHIRVYRCQAHTRVCIVHTARMRLHAYGLKLMPSHRQAAGLVNLTKPHTA